MLAQRTSSSMVRSPVPSAACATAEWAAGGRAAGTAAAAAAWEAGGALAGWPCSAITASPAPSTA